MTTVKLTEYVSEILVCRSNAGVRGLPGCYDTHALSCKNLLIKDNMIYKGVSGEEQERGGSVELIACNGVRIDGNKIIGSIKNFVSQEKSENVICNQVGGIFK